MTMQHAPKTSATGKPYRLHDTTVPYHAGTKHHASQNDHHVASRQQSHKDRATASWKRWWRLFAILPFVVSVSGCGVLAMPCRVASAGLKMIPGVGHVLAAPTDACAGVID